MLSTPLGIIQMYFDGAAVPFKQTAVSPIEKFSGVDGCFLLSFHYVTDRKAHTLECRITGNFIDSFPEPGERQECISFYTEKGKLSLGCEASFGDYEDYGYDFDGDLLDDGICITLFPDTQSQTINFAVSWLLSCTTENDHETWCGADPWLLKQIARQEES